MSHYKVVLPNYSVGSGCYEDIPEITKYYGKKAVVIGGETAMSKAKAALLDAIKGSDVEIMDFIWYGGESSYENGDQLKEMQTVLQADMIFAVGGGRACDTGKYVADQLKKPAFTFPTLGSNCAACTAISVIYNPDHTFKEYYYPEPAIHTFIDMDIVADSPADYLWAGIGDALSKEPEAVFSSKDDDLFHTPLLGVQLSHSCTKPLLRYGKKALEDCRAKKASFELEQVTLDIIISTGIVSNLVSGEDYYYNSSLAHAFYNGSTVVENSKGKHLHGEIVSFGVLIQLVYAGKPDQFDEIAAFNHSFGLPVCLSDLDITAEDIPQIVERAKDTEEWRHKPADVTTEKFMDAIFNADKRGKTFAEL
mgnify:CR=1 FL=1